MELRVTSKAVAGEVVTTTITTTASKREENYRLLPSSLRAAMRADATEYRGIGSGDDAGSLMQTYHHSSLFSRSVGRHLLRLLLLLL